MKAIASGPDRPHSSSAAPTRRPMCDASLPAHSILAPHSSLRIRWLEAVADQATRRVEQLFRELQASAPLLSYRSLVHRHARLQARAGGQEYRLVQGRAGRSVASCTDNVMVIWP